MTERRIPALDGWRGLAIALVLIGHFLPVPGIELARFGVELFFVLSGRLMAQILFVERVPLRSFVVRRAARVVPALLVFVAAVAVVYRLPARAVVPALTFTANYTSAFGARTRVLDHLWSLCVEEHGYLVLACVAALGRPGVACLGLATLAAIDGAVSTWVLGQPYVEVYWRSDVRAASILVAAGVWVVARGRAVPGGPWWIVPALVASVSAVPDPVKYTVGTGCLALAVTGAERWRWLSHPALVALGTVSFSLYLWQQPLYAASGSPALRLVAALGLAIVSYVAIERPARRAIRGLD